jgi:hypothetical protein
MGEKNLQIIDLTAFLKEIPLLCKPIILKKFYIFLSIVSFWHESCKININESQISKRMDEK